MRRMAKLRQKTAEALVAGCELRIDCTPKEADSIMRIVYRAKKNTVKRGVDLKVRPTDTGVVVIGVGVEPVKGVKP